MRHFDVQLMGGMVLHQGKIAEMATGEGKTLVATLPAVLNGLDRQGRPHRHGQRLPGPPRRRSGWGPSTTSWGCRSRSSSTRRPSSTTRPTCRPIRLAGPSSAPAAAGGLPGRHHLRDEQRVRLRLPARQHALLARGAGPAGAALRHRRRGRLDPDRRGADPAHHLGAGRGVDRPLLQGRPDHPPAHPGGHHHRGQAPRDRGGPHRATSSSTRRRRR